jgi:hypothetical protein
MKKKLPPERKVAELFQAIKEQEMLLAKGAGLREFTQASGV